MTTPRGAHFQFGCPRCLARLRARPSQVGTKKRCPRCQYELIVPTAEEAARLARRPEAYPVFEGEYQEQLDPQRAAETAAVADCPACGTRIYAPEDQIGHQVECPDCGSLVVASARPAAAEAAGELSAAEIEAYALLDQLYEPPESPASEAPSPDEQVYIPVYCPVCNTLLHGTLEEVGKHLLCPDCNTPVLVPPPREPAEARKPVSHPVEDEYALKEEVPRPGASAPEKEEVLIPVVCRVCQTRMYGTEDQVGELITCPDCGTPALVPRPEAPPPKTARTATAGGEYGVGEPTERPKYEPRVDARLMRIEPGDTKTAEEIGTAGIVYVRPPPPDRPFTRGIIGFLWHPSTWPRLVGLMLGMLLVMPLVAFAVWLINLNVALPLMAVMIFMGAAATFVMIWFAVAAAFLLAIVQDTAEGNDEIEAWPEGMFTDWAFDFLYFVAAFVAGALPGAVVLKLLSGTPLPSWTAVPASVFFLFPVVLLSMLANSSPLVPVSGPVWGSLFLKWWAWAIFYLETAALAFAYLALTELLLRLLGVWGSVPAALASVAVMMIYCRLLGRLAWCSSQGAEEEEEEEEDAGRFDDPRPPEARPAPRPTAAQQPVPKRPPPPQEVAPEPPPREVPPQPPPKQKPASSLLDDDFDLP